MRTRRFRTIVRWVFAVVLVVAGVILLFGMSVSQGGRVAVMAAGLTALGLGLGLLTFSLIRLGQRPTA